MSAKSYQDEMRCRVTPETALCISSEQTLPEYKILAKIIERLASHKSRKFDVFENENRIFNCEVPMLSKYYTNNVKKELKNSIEKRSSEKDENFKYLPRFLDLGLQEIINSKLKNKQEQLEKFEEWRKENRKLKDDNMSFSTVLEEIGCIYVTPYDPRCSDPLESVLSPALPKSKRFEQYKSSIPRGTDEEIEFCEFYEGLIDFDSKRENNQETLLATNNSSLLYNSEQTLNSFLHEGESFDLLDRLRALTESKDCQRPRLFTITISNATDQKAQETKLNCEDSRSNKSNVQAILEESQVSRANSRSKINEAENFCMREGLNSEHNSFKPLFIRSKTNKIMQPISSIIHNPNQPFYNDISRKPLLTEASQPRLRKSCFRLGTKDNKPISDFHENPNLKYRLSLNPGSVNLNLFDDNAAKHTSESPLRQTESKKTILIDKPQRKSVFSRMYFNTSNPRNTLSPQRNSSPTYTDSNSPKIIRTDATMQTVKKDFKIKAGMVAPLVAHPISHQPFKQPQGAETPRLGWHLGEKRKSIIESLYCLPQPKDSSRQQLNRIPGWEDVPSARDKQKYSPRGAPSFLPSLRQQVK